MFGTDIMIELRMFGFTNIPELVSPPPPSILKTPEGCKNKSCVFAFLYFHSPPVCTIQHFLFYPNFVPKIWGNIQVGLLSVGPAGGRAQFLKCMYNSTFLILSLFLCQTFGGVIKFYCCLWALSGPEGGRHNF